MNVGVIGLGLIGGSIAQRLAGLPGYAVRGFDVDGAARDGIELAASGAALAEASELVIVAAPPARTGACVVQALAANPSALVADVASVKAPILDEVRGAVPDALDRFLPTHPLAGAETGGWDAATPELLDQAVWAVCPPSEDAPAELLCRWAAVFDSFDARLVVCEAAEHDIAVARTSHAPHLIAVAIASAVDDPLAAVLSGGALRDMTRVARSDPELWCQILGLNRESLRLAVEDHIEILHRLAEGDASEDWLNARPALERMERLRWDEPQWGERSFDWPAWDELVQLGHEGVALRRPSFSGERLSVELTKRA